MGNEMVKESHIENLSEYSSADVLDNLTRLDKIPVPMTNEEESNPELVRNLALVKDINGANKEVDLLGKFGLTISIDELVFKGLPEPLSERITGNVRGEIYIISSVFDGSGMIKQFQSQLFKGVKEHSRLELGTGGMLVAYIENPRWFIDMHIMIMELDGEFNKIPDAVEKAKKNSMLDDILEGISVLSLLSPVKISETLEKINVFYDLLGKLLEENGDDCLGIIHDFHLKHKLFGVGKYPLKKYGSIEAAYTIGLTRL